MGEALYIVFLEIMAKSLWMQFHINMKRAVFMFLGARLRLITKARSI